MAKKTYEVGEAGAEWVSGQLGQPVEAGVEVDMDVTEQQETALVAAGWLVAPDKPKRKGD
jgi:hypothetical protein